MQDDYPRRTTSVVVWLICAITAGFILQNVMLHWFQLREMVLGYFAVTIPGLQAGRIWTLATYSLLHAPDNLLHIVGNLLGLYFLGRELLPLLGSRRFLGLYSAATLMGALVWAATHWTQGGTLVGASAGVCALLVVFACFYPHQQMTFLLFFIFPVTLKPKYVAIAFALIDLGGFVFYEVLGAVSPFGFAHSAHLGGMAVGWLYFRHVHQAQWGFHSGRPEIELPRWMQKRPKASIPPSPPPPQQGATVNVNAGNRMDLRAEVDRILDKINSQGFGALTADEKRLLDEAKDSLSRR